MQFVFDGDTDIYVLGLQDTRTGNYITAATVSAQIVDNSGADVGSPITLTSLNSGGSTTIYYPPGKTTISAGGNYRGQVLASEDLVRGMLYTLKVTATSGGSTWYDEAELYCKIYDGAL